MVQMKSILCTLFNVNYLDKGIVLYNSLETVCSEFVLYVLAMDDRCYEVLTSLNRPFLIPIKLSDFENEQLIAAKKNRSFGDYCCTCSSSLIKYILDTYEAHECTYIDADMCFYSDPSIIIKEMYDKGASALVVSHRFDKYAKSTQFIVGRYCVEFNTFRNDANGRTLLDNWVNQCLNSCERANDGVHYGDQRYTDEWTDKYDFVVETTFDGAGVAPWNVRHYRWINPDQDGNPYILKYNGVAQPLIFYHFENLRYLSRDTVYISAFRGWFNDSHFIYHIYSDYLNKIESVKKMLLQNHNVDILLKSHPAITNKSKKISRYIGYIKNFIPFIMLGLPTKLFKRKNIINLKPVK